MDVDLIDRFSPVPGGRNFVNFLGADGQTSQWPVVTMARFGQMSLAPSLMDGIFPSVNMSPVPSPDELIKMVQ